MLSGKRFSLTRSTIAVDMVDGKHTAVGIPAGATIEVLPGSRNGDTTVEVLWDGRDVVMFVVDVTERGTEVTELSATALPSNGTSKKRRGQRA